MLTAAAELGVLFSGEEGAGGAPHPPPQMASPSGLALQLQGRLASAESGVQGGQPGVEEAVSSGTPGAPLPPGPGGPLTPR